MAVAAAGLWLVHGAAAQALPSGLRLSDPEFWGLVESLSEPGGSFVTDNRLSNERAYQQVIPELRRREQAAYVGVGPEQNFTYIAALKPAIAFIVDIRRQNLLLHLLYKAFMELSADRTEFMSRLFGRLRPGGTGPHSSASALFGAFGAISTSQAVAEANLRQAIDHLENTHGFRLDDEDERGLGEVYASLYRGGPHMRGNFGGGSWMPSYAELMAETDLSGRRHSYLASEENFQAVKTYQAANLIVPLVGDFGGDHTLTALSRFLRDRGLTVTTFYASNVEEYLFKQGTWQRFVANVEALPTDERSMVIRAHFTGTEGGLHSLVDPIRDLLDAAREGHIRSYADLVSRSRAPAP
jgi:hypothetical protein